DRASIAQDIAHLIRESGLLITLLGAALAMYWDWP
ncbi:hypothetical protein PSYPI_49232, partial [Pseudomonas syringae pv. pisi str. 1704B]